MEIKEKEKEEKTKMMEKVVEKQGVQSKATDVQLHSFTKATTLCKPKIGGETKLPTSFHSNQARIKFSRDNV